MRGEPDERRRVGAVYAGYARSRRKRRSWAAGNPGNVAIRAELVDTAFAMAGADLRAADAILDVGCGTGWWLEALAARSDLRARLHGVDVLAARVKAAGERVAEARLAAADARHLPYRDGEFSVLSLFTVLSSLSGPDDVAAVLRDAQRVLAPGGVLLIWEPRVANPLNLRTLLISQASLIGGLGACGAVHSRTMTLLPPLARRLGPRTGRLYPRLARIPALRTHRLIVARKL